jgi:myo-inositol-1(or 4)-monophosphatase
MDQSAIAARYAFALELIRAAGDFAHGYFRARNALTIKSKGPQDMASEADVNTELMIRDRLGKAFPGDGFLGEETGEAEFQPGQGIWVVDPIDGTQPFISGLTSWCVSIAFVAEGRVLFGMVYAPARGELFAGGEGFPATLNGQPVERHPGRSIKQGIVATGYSTRLPPSEFLPRFARFLEAGGMFYRDGSGALNLCYVAAGRLIGYAEAHINSWDCLGGIAVIRAAGLKTSDFLAGDGLRSGNRLIAGNDQVYAELEAIFG